MNSAETNKFYIPSLDGIRAFAMMIVLVSHTGYEHLVPGRTGVTIFFFLSGYLITTLMMKEFEKNGKINLSKFLKRRFLRLSPPILIFLTSIYILAYFSFIPGGVSWKAFFFQYFYLANYFEIFWSFNVPKPQGTIVLWSLAVEEHFYFLYPIIMMFVLKRFSYKKIIYIFIGVSVLILLWRFWLVSQPNFPKDRNAFGSDTRFDSILYGCILALSGLTANFKSGLSTVIKYKDYLILLTGCALFAFTLLPHGLIFRESIRYTIQGVALIPIFYYAIMKYDSWIFKVFQISWIRKLGIYSYVIYLTHYSLYFLLKTNVSFLNNAPILTVSTLLLSVLLAGIYDKYVEVYFKKARSKLRA